MATGIGESGVSLQFFRMFSDPFQWLTKARELRAAAAAVETVVAAKTNAMARWIRDEPSAEEYRSVTRHPNVHDQWIMLLHFMLENVIKGWAIARDPTLIKEEKEGQLHGRLAQHDLSVLAKNVGLDLALSADDEAVLGYMHDTAVGKGRYPCRRAAEQQARSSEVDLAVVGETAEGLYRRCAAGLVRAMREVKPDREWRLGARSDLTLEQWTAFFALGEEPILDGAPNLATDTSMVDR
jgi:hypothetical protein